MKMEPVAPRSSVKRLLTCCIHLIAFRRLPATGVVKKTMHRHAYGHRISGDVPQMHLSNRVVCCVS